MESTHVRESDDRSLLGRLHGSGVRALHGQREKRPPAMVGVRIAGPEAPEVALVEDHHPIQTLPPDAPDHPLGIGILPGAPRGGQDLVDAQVRHAALKPRAIHGIAIAKQVLGRGLPGAPWRPWWGSVPRRSTRPPPAAVRPGPSGTSSWATNLPFLATHYGAWMRIRIRNRGIPRGCARKGVRYLLTLIPLNTPP